jgi:transposase
MLSRKPAELPAEIAVLILVEFIQNRDSSFEDLKRAISRKTRVAIDARQIQWLFEQHGLKKTTPTQVPPPGEP